MRCRGQEFSVVALHPGPTTPEGGGDKSEKSDHPSACTTPSVNVPVIAATRAEMVRTMPVLR